MKSWLTTHYPHPYPDNLPWHIYLQREHKSAVNGIGIGDQVFFYEYKYHKPLKDGTLFLPGRQGIVRVASVSGRVYAREADIEYADGHVASWSWGVPTSDADEEGFVRLNDVLRVIGYSGGYLRGFNGGTGIMQLNNGQAQELMRLFKSAHKVAVRPML